MADSPQYQHDIAKLPDSGLQLNLPVDLVPVGQYSYFSNALSRIEGEVQTRDGLVKVCTVGMAAIPIHSIFRLNEVVPGINGERLFGVGTQLWTAPLPAGNVPVQLTAYIVAGTVFPAFPVGFDGTPLSMIPFRFDQDPQAWVIIANGQKMMKQKAGYYEQLGLPAPTVAPIASAGGAGLLNGDYQWLYTYVNTVTNTESNPSAPSGIAGGTEIKRPTTFTSPSNVPSFYGLPAFNDAWANPGNAFDGNPATFALGGSAAPKFQSSCQWQGFAAASGAYSSLELHVIVQADTTSVDSGTFDGDYSLDGGATWNGIYGVSTPGFGQKEFIISLPVNTDLTQLIVAAFNSDTESLGTTNMYEIWTVGVLSGSSAAPLTLTNQSAIVCVAAPIDPQETAIRLYRTGGTITDGNYYFVSQSLISSLVQGACGANYLEIDDNIPDATILAAPIASFDNFMPVPSVQLQNVPLKAIWNFDERVLGVGDPSRPESVYFSLRGNADSWGAENWVVVAEPGTEAMNGFFWNLRCWVFSRERLYTLLLNIIAGQTFTPQDTVCRRGLKGRWAFCIGEKGIYFVSKDGIYVTVGGPEESVADEFIRPLFPSFDAPGEDANGYEAINMDDEDGLRLERHNSEIWFDYTGATTGKRQTLIYDERKKRWRGYYRGDLTSSKAQMHYSEPGTVSSLLTGGVEANVYQGQLEAADDGASILVHVRTGARDQGVPLNLKQYGNVVFDIDPGGATLANPVTITPYLNGDQLAQAAITVTGTGRQRFALNLENLGEVFALNIAFDITWTTNAGAIAPILYQTDTLYRVEPAAVRHWEVPPSSLGIEGWFHVRDSYLTLRSNANVTMKLTPDNGPVQTFTISSTGGAKKKIYVPFAANKVKLVGFSFDSSADFRIYQQECELRAKQWVVAMGYKTIALFGAEAE